VAVAGIAASAAVILAVLAAAYGAVAVALVLLAFSVGLGFYARHWLHLAGRSRVVNAVCPGLTATWPGAEAMGARPIHEGAASVAWGAHVPDDGPRGGFFRDGHQLPW
jgi:hypothetical protein